MKALLTTALLGMAASPAFSGTCEILSAHVVPGYMNDDVLEHMYVYVKQSQTLEGFLAGTSYPEFEYRETWDSIMENLDATFSVVEEFNDTDGATIHRVTMTTKGQLPTGVIYVFIADCGGAYQ